MGTETDARVILDRGVAAAIDLLVCLVLLEMPALYLYGELFTAQYEALGAALIPLSLALLVFVFIIYSMLFEWVYGQTPGKVNRRLVVVMADGGDVTVHASGRRNLLLWVDLLGIPPLVVGLLSALVADGRRVGDFVAGTRVVRTAKPAEPETVIDDPDASASHGTSP